MWFVLFLLVATTAYLIWTRLLPVKPGVEQPQRPFPGFQAILALGLILGLVTAIVRIFSCP